MAEASSKDKSALGGYFLNARILYNIAIDAYRRARDRDSDENVVCSDSLVAIVFAAASIEAFVNQIIVTGEIGPSLGRHGLAVLSRILKLLEKDAPVATKYELVHLILTGDACAKGERPYQDLDVLITLRNWLAHMKPEPLDAVGVTRHLENRQVLRPKKGNAIESQLGRLGTVDVARWACDTAADVTQAIAKLFRSANDVQNQVLSTMFGGFDRIKDAE